MWNQFVFPFSKADISVEQGSTLSPILSTLYIAHIFHIFKIKSKILLSLIQTLILSFVDDSLFISQEKNYKKSNANIFIAIASFSLYLTSSV